MERRKNINTSSRAQEVILKRAADLAEALYTMPRNNQLSLSLPRSPCSRDRDGNNMSSTAGGAGTGFNPYTGQLAVTVHDHSSTGQWNDGEWCTANTSSSRSGGKVDVDFASKAATNERELCLSDRIRVVPF